MNEKIKVKFCEKCGNLLKLYYGKLLCPKCDVKKIRELEREVKKIRKIKKEKRRGRRLKKGSLDFLDPERALKRGLIEGMSMEQFNYLKRLVFGGSNG